MMQNMDMSFNVNLPYAAIKNNATSTKDKDRSLTWSLTTQNQENIEFEFELYNTTNIILLVLFAIVVIAGIVVIILKSGKKAPEVATNAVAQNPTNSAPVDNASVVVPPVAEPTPEMVNPTVEVTDAPIMQETEENQQV